MCAYLCAVSVTVYEWLYSAPLLNSLCTITLMCGKGLSRTLNLFLKCSSEVMSAVQEGQVLH